jgi:hypothetical protein
MADARLLECGRHDPDLSFWSGNSVCNLFQHFQAGRVDPVIIRYQNSHVCPLIALRLA